VSLSVPADGSVFVSIAAYRDPGLLPTITDCLGKARHPERLRFGICWQYGPEMTGSEYLEDPQFTVRYVDARLSHGACWARSEVMKLYSGEDWYLQLDSHHRFTPDWDEKLVEQAALTGSAKPLLTTYAAGFEPGADAAEEVTTMAFDCFTDEGVLLPKPATLTEPRAAPVRARFLSAHFLFAPGSFVPDVPYDPELYFLGEEITLAVRAFTHGYDLFHPARHILWHEYTRAGRAKHWDDHVHESGSSVAWWERDEPSLAKAARFLTDPWEGPDGAGTERSVADYEAYAGVSFRHRRVQDYTRLNHEPPNPSAAPYWAERMRDTALEIRLDPARLPPDALEDSAFWYVGVHDGAGEEIYRQDAEADEITEQRSLAGGGPITLRRFFSTQRAPSTWTVFPHTVARGWLTPIVGGVPGEAPIFVSVAAYRDPDLANTIADCLVKASRPERLRFVVCWQHGPDEQLPDWMSEEQVRVLDVDWRDSRGDGWARAQIMKEWSGEDWFLQIDSHHRFAPGWDTTLLEQATLTGSPRPLLSAPAPAFTIGAPHTADSPLRAEFTGFGADGIPDIRAALMDVEPGRRTPVRARAVCGHLLFAPGSFAADVPCDPDLYYAPDGAVTALRAFTSGYDLFHPTTVVTWHAYTWANRTMHWDDHTGHSGTGLAWHELRQRAIAKVAEFFADPLPGPFGLGSERTLADYEKYAGVSFCQRRVQDYTRRGGEPPNPPADADWAARVRDHTVEIALDLESLPPGATEDPVLWYIGVHDSEGRELYRQDTSEEELKGVLATGGAVSLFREFTSSAMPASWTILPLSASQGWLAPLTRRVRAA
jgi:hypothetical protein